MEETPKTTDPKPGSETSEYKLTKAMMTIGALLATAGTVLSALPQDNKWVSVAAIVVGSLTALLSKLGYVQSRTTVKVAAAAGAAPVPPPAPSSQA